MASDQARAQVWITMPLSSKVFFFVGVFCLFGTLVLTVSSADFQSQSVWDVAETVVIAGAFAILWAYVAAMRRYWWFAVLGPMQGVANYYLHRYGPIHYSLAGDLPTLKHKFVVDAWVEFALILAGYVLFLIFFGREGNRFFRTRTEVQLAGKIHGALVPQQHLTIDAFEMFGSSVPSSEVGGDLFDIVQSHGTWHAYIADVSGHGVAAGMLMAMIKSATSMQLTKSQRPDHLLQDLNEVLQPVTAPANYLTFAYVSGNTSPDLTFALAGHLPVLHYQKFKRKIVERSDSNVPIGLFRNQTFVISKLTLEPGDLLALITDGFTEIFDSHERELGLEDFKGALSNCAENPLPEIYAELRARTLKFGKQTDDQTMLLIRRL